MYLKIYATELPARLRASGQARCAGWARRRTRKSGRGPGPGPHGGGLGGPLPAFRLAFLSRRGGPGPHGGGHGGTSHSVGRDLYPQGTAPREPVDLPLAMTMAETCRR